LRRRTALPRRLQRVDARPTSVGENDKTETIKKSVGNAATIFSGLWLFYLYLLLVIVISVGGVTQVDLFLDKPVNVSFLGKNIELSITTFFFLAPVIFLVVHAYTLVYLVIVTDKAKRFHRMLYSEPNPGKERSTSDAGARQAELDALQAQSSRNIFLEFPVTSPDIPGLGGWLSTFAWATLEIRPVIIVLLIVAPCLTLLFVQVQFLPFHSSSVTWTHRVALLADLALIGWLWRKTAYGGETDGRKSIGAWALSASAILLGLGVLLFSWTIATFPGEVQERLFATAFHDVVFNSPVDVSTRRRLAPFSNTLVLTGFNVLEGLHIDDPKKDDGRDFIFRARGRDLKGANFDFASLPRIDFTGAILDGASFFRAQLDRTSFERAQLQGASLVEAHLQDASLVGAQLPRVSLLNAQLQGASLDGAQLQGALLVDAQLQRASLVGAQLEGARLDTAQLQGASFDGAGLEAALLAWGQLQGASFDHAGLQGASLVGAQLEGASLNMAQLQGASFGRAQLQGASLNMAQLQGVEFALANLDAADLSHASLWRAGGRLESGKDLELAAAVWGPFSFDFTGPNSNYQQPWSDMAYQNLRKTIEAVPAGDLRDRALAQIGRLDCANPDKALAPCDPAAPLPPPGVIGFRAAASDEDYRKALAATLKSIVCAGSDESIFVLRGISRRGVSRPGILRPSRLAVTGAEAPALIDFIMSPDCPVSAKLTDDDRAMLMRTKQDALKKPGG
jgi:uncharacterized protein YjbI with pentapeptide repeats